MTEQGSFEDYNDQELARGLEQTHRLHDELGAVRLGRDAEELTPEQVTSNQRAERKIELKHQIRELQEGARELRERAGNVRGGMYKNPLPDPRIKDRTQGASDLEAQATTLDSQAEALERELAELDGPN